MAKLLEISDNLKAILDQIEANDGEVTDELYEELQNAEEDLESKCYGYYNIIKKYEATNTTIEEEVKRLTAKKKANENLIDKLKEILKLVINTHGTINTKSKAKELPKVLEYETLKLTATPYDKIIVQEDAVPYDFMQYTIKDTLNNEDLIYLEEMYKQRTGVSFNKTDCKPNLTKIKETLEFNKVADKEIPLDFVSVEKAYKLNMR